ncbi:FKBP-type peptidyl-prolyl cis-trans isomerase [Aeromonas simiae]|uniref:FKBP-type peptidyl-prolyl cis-trans isomerase n=1 Tax=Aeromonas simiae TaxID=218936 RepID=UPI00266BCC34|nr:FKBP-type peptidyl-prolyl cis-trans isomerase [Aeromonas simiae]MDO2948093.1 FKBP-type peptidyl-prolyl cis-trans isomerase [Aeromonas simiae]MDO2952832.1 FKBP-type peptidyl-prolyl cis-trans isomerase [Aeromonas simiae]MDO2955488.1 FKBP-type peptidyl-prolyl cis-trans isomerase [Aeromonas simiae]
MKLLLLVAAIGLAFYLYSSSQARRQAGENMRMGDQFLQENRGKPGIYETDSGLQYEVLHESEGPQPQAGNRVKVHYEGRLLDGTVFDSSYARGEPISFGLNQVIPGWTEGLQLMHQGEKMRLFIPARLGYGERSAGKIPPGSLLIFDVELLGIE